MSNEVQAQPATEGAAATSPGGLQLGASRSRPVGHGWRWISQAWSLFAPAWGSWILAALLFIVIVSVVQVIPMIGMLASMLLSPLLTAGILAMAHRAHEGGGVEIADLFVAFRERTGPLLGLAALNLGVSVLLFVVILVPVLLSTDFTALAQMNPEDQAAVESVMADMGTGAVLGLLIMLALFIPWLAAYWFAIPLVFFGNYRIGEALKSSLIACLRNILPMLWFSIIVLALSLVAAIPFFLGLIVLIPVMMITHYSMFRDIFSDA